MPRSAEERDDARMLGMASCRHCSSDRDTCPRCGYMACACTPCACKTGVGSQRAQKAMAFFDANGCSEEELARRQLRELIDAVKSGSDDSHDAE